MVDVSDTPNAARPGAATRWNALPPPALHPRRPRRPRGTLPTATANARSSVRTPSSTSTVYRGTGPCPDTFEVPGTTWNVPRPLVAYGAVPAGSTSGAAESAGLPVGLSAGSSTSGRVSRGLATVVWTPLAGAGCRGEEARATPHRKVATTSTGMAYGRPP